MPITEIDYGYTKVEGIPSFHLHFQTLWKKKEELKTSIDTVKLSPEYITSMEHKVAAREYIHFFQMRDDSGTPSIPYPIFYKLDKKLKVKFVVDYIDTYLINTLIKEILCAGDDGAARMAKWVVYQLYYFRLFKSEVYEEMCNSVISEIADIISIIIRKEYTLYRDFNTAVTIAELRKAHKAERIFQLGRTGSYRRKY